MWTILRPFKVKQYIRIIIIITINKMHREVDFECSPYLDKEYDIPMVKDVVNQMISNELKTFAPKDYLTFLPYPKLNFADSPLLQSGTIYIYIYLTIN